MTDFSKLEFTPLKEISTFPFDTNKTIEHYTMSTRPWHLIPSNPAIDRISISDMTPPQRLDELARLGNNYQKVAPRLAGLIALAVSDMRRV